MKLVREKSVLPVAVDMAGAGAEQAVVVGVGTETGGNTIERGFVAAPRGVIFPIAWGPCFNGARRTTRGESPALRRLSRSKG